MPAVTRLCAHTAIVCAMCFGPVHALDDGTVEPRAQRVANVMSPIEGPHVVTGITAPFQAVTLGAVVPGRIMRVLVEEGQAVGQGDLLVVLDDRGQRVRTELAKAEADSDLRVRQARLVMDFADRELKRLSDLFGDDFAAAKETRDARLLAEERRLEFAIAEFDLAQAKRLYERERVLLEQLSIRSPFDGFVRELLLHEGETVNEREGVIKVVQVDPLEIVLDCPLSSAEFATVGRRLTIHASDARWGRRVATLTYAAKTADAASQTLRVKMRLPNPEGRWIAGLKVYVDLAEQVEPDKTAGGSTQGEQASRGSEQNEMGSPQ